MFGCHAIISSIYLMFKFWNTVYVFNDLLIYTEQILAFLGPLFEFLKKSYVVFDKLERLWIPEQFMHFDLYEKCIMSINVYCSLLFELLKSIYLVFNNYTHRACFFFYYFFLFSPIIIFFILQEWNTNKYCLLAPVIFLRWKFTNNKP